MLLEYHYFSRRFCFPQNDAVLDMKKLYPDIFSGHNKNNDPNVDSKIIKENFLKAAIFYDDLSHERISEVPMYTVGLQSYTHTLLRYHGQ